MGVDEYREAARQLIATMPAVVQAVVTEIRRSEGQMPMAHFRTLMVLAHRERRCTLSDLAQKHQVSLPTVSNTVSVLVDHGWVERVADENDRRRVELRLTPAGEEAARRVQKSVEDILVKRFGDMPDEDLRKLTEGLGVLRAIFGEHTHDFLTEGGAA